MTRKRLELFVSRSKNQRTFFSGVPKPVSSLIASMAAVVPTMTALGPITGNTWWLVQVLRLFRIDAAKAGSLARHDRRDVALHAEHGAHAQRFALRHGFPIHQITLLEQRSAVDDQVRLCHQPGDIGFIDAVSHRYDFDIGIDALQPRGPDVDEGAPEIGGEQQLATVKKVGLDAARMCQYQLADSGADEVHCGRSADPANPRDEDGGRLETALRLLPKPLKADLSLVALQIEFGEFRLVWNRVHDIL